MTAHTAVRSTHQTLSANAADTVTVTVAAADDDDAAATIGPGARAFAYPLVEVLNRDASSPLYFTADGTAATVEGAGTYVVPAGGALTVEIEAATVSVISAAAVAYSVTGMSR